MTTRLAIGSALLAALGACSGAPSPARAPEGEPPPHAQAGLRVGDALPLGGPIEFDVETAVLRPGSLPVLDDIAELLREQPALARIEIQAHLDGDPDREAYGRKVSQQRAGAVRDYLIQRGVAADRLVAAGYEDSRPLLPHDTPEGRRANQRIELRILEIR